MMMHICFCIRIMQGYYPNNGDSNGEEMENEMETG